MWGKGPRWTHPRLLTCFVTSPGLTERGRARRRDTSGVVAGRMGDTGRIADPQMGSGVADGRARVRDASQTAEGAAVVRVPGKVQRLEGRLPPDRTLGPASAQPSRPADSHLFTSPRSP